MSGNNQKMAGFKPTNAGEDGAGGRRTNAADNVWVSATGPSSGCIQQHYVNIRSSEFKRRGDRENLKLEAKKIIQKYSPIEMEENGLEQMYQKINKSLQASDLTINFKENEWFKSECNYYDYINDYVKSERLKGKKNAFFNSDVNQAWERVKADDVVTIPSEWENAPQTILPKRGLMPVNRTREVKQSMEFGKHVEFTKNKLKYNNESKQHEIEASNSDKGVASINSNFRAETKQIFAALNYGRRVNGANTYYGKSFFILNNRFKANALYFPADTFLIYQKAGISYQVPYSDLAILLVFATENMQRNIIRSCAFGGSLDNTVSPELLLEAHIFQKIPFTGDNILEMRLSNPNPTVHTHAQDFAKKWGIKLTVIG